MSQPSPYLAAILSNRNSQSSETLNQAGAQAQALLDESAELERRRALLTESRGAPPQDIETALASHESRWRERLRRLDQWNADLSELRRQTEEWNRLASNRRLFERIDVLAEPLAAKIYRQAQRLEQRRV